MVAPTWNFDAARFGATLAAHRVRVELSTRELARRADVSQSYIVALEGARHRGVGPTPTVDLVARLAGALGVAPTELFRAGLRRNSTHVLLVVDQPGTPSLQHVRAAAPEGAQQWVVATSAGTAPLADLSIDLRRRPRATYQPAQVKQALRRELTQVQAALNGADVGFVFDDTSSVMHTSGTPHAVLDFEEEWASVVNDAARAVGAHAAWNVCVYALEHLRALADPVAATVDLMRHHDTTWFGRTQHVEVGVSAARAVLLQMQPTSVAVDEWAATVDTLTHDLTFAA